MIVILSPAKNMNIEKFENFELENPSFFDETNKIHKYLDSLEPQDIESIMKVNKEIAFKTMFLNFG